MQHHIPVQEIIGVFFNEVNYLLLKLVPSIHHKPRTPLYTEEKIVIIYGKKMLIGKTPYFRQRSRSSDKRNSVLELKKYSDNLLLRPLPGRIKSVATGEWSSYEAFCIPIKEIPSYVSGQVQRLVPFGEFTVFN